MNDHITISRLEVYAKHGVLPEENTLGQKFIISVKMFLDLGKAGKNDDLTQSVDYGKVCHDIYLITVNNTFELIETLAYKITVYLLNNYKLIKSVETTVEKPWAPIGLPLDTVSVTVKRERHTAYIALGSNMGDREKYINTAVDRLNRERGCIVAAVSDLIETKPYGVTDQDDFLNGVLKLETYLTPHELLDLLHTIENESGRVRERRWGPRTLDLDIIFYDDLIMSDEELCIPHPDMHNREFVLKPLAQIAPFVMHPILKQTAEKLAFN